MDRVTAQSRAGVETSSLSLFGLKVFMDAHNTVTVEEGDRYPLRPPSYGEAGATASVIHQFLETETYQSVSPTKTACKISG
jgi:hypothetical protein